MGGVSHISAHGGQLSRCLQTSRVPGASEFVELLKPARGSLSAYIRKVGVSIAPPAGVPACPGQWWQVSSHGEKPSLCISKGDKLTAVHLPTIHMEITHHLQGTAVPLSLPAKCSSIMPLATTSPPKNLAASIDDTWASAAAATPSVASATPTKDCVFIHGVGNKPTKGSASILIGSYPYYWGQVQDFTPQCKSWVFLNVETVERGWDNAELQDQVCRVATYDVATKSSSMGKISNRIVFTHSMVNMMMAGAIESGRCGLDMSSSTWYEVSGPMYGSKMSTALDKICSGSDWSLYKLVASKLGYCTGGSVSAAYKSLEPTHPGLKGIAATIGPRLSGALCGTSAYGLASIYSVELAATAELAGFAS